MRFLIFFLLLPVFISGQSVLDSIIHEDYTVMYAAELIESIQDRYRVSIYYKKDDIVGGRITIQASGESLASALEQVLVNEKLGVFEYRGDILIMPRKLMEETFSSEYYENLYLPDPEPSFAPEFILGDAENMKPSGMALVKGRILDKQMAEPIIGATILIANLEEGTVSDEYGTFEIEVPLGKHNMNIQYLGFNDYEGNLQVFNDGVLEIGLEKSSVDLDVVVVKGKAADFNIKNSQIGLQKLEITSIKKLPKFMGETDLIRSLLLQPGISSVGEGAIGFNVRGGNTDQNLVLQSNGMVFNTSHALGFFSTFNADLIKSVSLYKANMPAQYGGRLSSVLDVELRDGDFKSYSGKASISPVTTKINVEGPIISKKLSFLAGFRSTYSNWILNFVNVPEVKNSKIFFYDANLNLSYRVNEKNTLKFSTYLAQDRFSFNEDFGFDYSSQNFNLLYKKIFSDRLFSNFNAGIGRYESQFLDLSSNSESVLETQVSNYTINELVTYIVNDRVSVKSGFSSIFYAISPGSFSPNSETSTVIPEKLDNDYGLESALFSHADYTISPRWSLSAGLRYNFYQKIGPATVFTYEDSGAPSLSSVTGARDFEWAEVVTNYDALEPRISGRYSITSQASVKFGYSRTSQFLSQIVNTNTSTPSSLWKLSDTYIQPLRSSNYSVGYFHNFKNNLWETSMEVYFRDISRSIDYVDFAQLNSNPQIETELLTGTTHAYGAELSVKKTQGKYYGWVSYSLSRTLQRIAGINNGEWYLSNLDRPHDLSVLVNYQPNTRNTLTLNFIFASGRPTTAPIASYQEEGGMIIPIYSARNKLRIPDFHRLDFSYTQGKNFRKDRKFKTSWTFSLYNVYSRRNAFSVYYEQLPFSRPQAYKLSILGSVFPSITFNIESI